MVCGTDCMYFPNIDILLSGTQFWLSHCDTVFRGSRPLPGGKGSYIRIDVPV